MSTSSISATAADLKSELPHSELPKFSGKPQFTQVRQIEKLIEENAGSIECSVPGTGEFNHIFLTKTDEEWTNLTGLPPVVFPVNPEEPNIRNNATAAQIAQSNQAYNRSKKIYIKTKAMKNLLINQIISSFEPKYMDCLKHAVTRQVNHQSIPAIFRVLYRYGKVKYQAVEDMHQELLSTPIDLELPLLLFFKEIEDYRALAQAAGMSKTNTEIIKLTITILKKCGSVLERDIREWNNRPAAEHTWANLIQHFDEAQRQLEDATDLPIGQTSLHGSANMIAENVSKAINNDFEHKLNVLSQRVETAIQNSRQFNESSPPSYDDYIDTGNDMDISYDDDEAPAIETPTTKLKNFFEEKINSIQDAHKKELKLLKNQISKVNNASSTSTSSNTRGNENKNNKRKRNERNNSKTGSAGDKKYYDGPRYRYDVSKYCWTHGACAHSGSECSNPAEGHKKKASFKDKMGGSLAFCRHAPKDE